MTRPASTYCERITRSTSVLGPRDPVAGLEIGRVDDLHLGERHLRFGVLNNQHRRRPLLPVRALAAREADRAVPALELAGQERLDQRIGVVALGGIERVTEEDHLSVAIQRAVDRILLV